MSSWVTDLTVTRALQASESLVIDIFMLGDLSGAGWGDWTMGWVHDCPQVQNQLPYGLSQHKIGLRMTYNKPLDLLERVGSCCDHLVPMEMGWDLVHQSLNAQQTPPDEKVLKKCSQDSIIIHKVHIVQHICLNIDQHGFLLHDRMNPPDLSTCHVNLSPPYQNVGSIASSYSHRQLWPFQAGQRDVGWWGPVKHKN